MHDSDVETNNFSVPSAQSRVICSFDPTRPTWRGTVPAMSWDQARYQRVLMAVAALVVPAAALFAAGAGAGQSPPAAARAADAPKPVNWDPQIVAVTGPGFPVGYNHYVVTPGQADIEAAIAARLATDRSVKFALPPGVGNERGLQVRTILAERAISANFPEISDIGGMRADPLKWHPNGLAIDVMIPNWWTPEGKELGDRIVRFAFENADLFGIDNVIWQRVFYPRSGTASYMPDLGNADANHLTHVHIATVGGGYPTGDESYFG